MEVFKKKFEIELTKNVLEFVQKSFLGYEDLFKMTLSMGEVVVFGGLPRDILFYERKIIDNQITRDIDLVVSNTSNERLYKIFQRVVSRRTRFGGIQCILKNRLVDIWALNETWAFNNGYLEPKIENLPKSVFLSIDSIVVNLGNGQLMQTEFFRSIDRREIDIVLEENPYPALCVLRAIFYRKKYAFKLSPKLKEYIQKYLSQTLNPLDRILETQISHYEKVVIPKAELIDEIKLHVY